MKGPSEIGGSPRIAGDRGGTDQDSVLPEGRGVIRGYYTVRGQPRGVIGAGGIRQCPRFMTELADYVPVGTILCTSPVPAPSDVTK